MMFNAADFDAALAAASGDDIALAAELRAVFIESAERQLDLLGRARCDGNWKVAATRLQGLAASFHASDLLELASEAASGAPGEPGVLRRIRGCLDEFLARGG